MDKLPEDLLLEILSRLDNSADVARCRIASKGFNTLYPRLRSINLQCTSQILRNHHSSSSFKTIFLNLISDMPVVESVCIGGESFSKSYIVCDLYQIDKFFLEKWLPRVSLHLKSLSVSNPYHRHWISDVLPLLSAYCHNLAVLKLKYMCLSLNNLKPMPLMTSLTLDSIDLIDTMLIQLIKCVPNLEVLNLIDVRYLGNPKIHHLNLKIFQLTVPDARLYNLSLFTPNLVTLKLKCIGIKSIYIQAPILSHSHLALTHLTAFKVRKFEKLKTLTLSASIASILNEFPDTKTVETLTVESNYWSRRDDVNSNFTLESLFTVFPNVSSLCIKSNAWWVEACYKQLDRETLYLKKGLKTFSAYLLLVLEFNGKILNVYV